MQQEHQTELLIGSAPCISFRTLLYPSGTKTQIDRVQDQERQYTRACIEAYRRQLIMGRHFLHEHPLHASSWCMPEMRELMNDGRVHLVQGPMCHWRLSSTGDGDEQEFVRGKTRWATSSSRLAALLARKHAGENRRVRLLGRNEMIAASMYSPKFVNETLRVLGKQLIGIQLDQQQTFLNWIHENGKKTITISSEIYLIQSKSRKEREKKSSRC